MTSKGPRGKRRLDQLLVELGLAESREKARAMVLAGQVLVEDEPATKPGRQVDPSVPLRVRQPLPYVSRGGLKLAAALDAFEIDAAGLVAADIGASTGGFTDCLLQRGAAHVYAIDVGYGQLAWTLRQDPRVTLLERTNARYLEELPGGVLVDLVVIDVSFIGLALILPAAARILRPGGQAVALIKPQFEAGRRQVARGGVVKDPAVHRQVLQRVLSEARDSGWAVLGLVRSPITGPKGNLEFLCLLERGTGSNAQDLASLVTATLDLPEAADGQV